jgi:hypothetical protein
LFPAFTRCSKTLPDQYWWMPSVTVTSILTYENIASRQGETRAAIS